MNLAVAAKSREVSRVANEGVRTAGIEVPIPTMITRATSATTPKSFTPFHTPDAGPIRPTSLDSTSPRVLLTFTEKGTASTPATVGGTATAQIPASDGEPRLAPQLFLSTPMCTAVPSLSRRTLGDPILWYFVRTLYIGYNDSYFIGLFRNGQPQNPQNAK